MAIHIRNPETDALARKLAARLGVSLTRAVHIALLHELEREEAAASAAERTRDFTRAFRASGDLSRASPSTRTS